MVKTLLGGCAGALAGVMLGAFLFAGRPVAAQGAQPAFHLIPRDGYVEVIYQDGAGLRLAGILTTELGYDDVVRRFKEIPKGHLRQRFVPWKQVLEDVGAGSPDGEGEKGEPR